MNGHEGRRKKKKSAYFQTAKRGDRKVGYSVIEGGSGGGRRKREKSASVPQRVVVMTALSFRPSADPQSGGVAATACGLCHRFVGDKLPSEISPRPFCVFFFFVASLVCRSSSSTVFPFLNRFFFSSRFFLSSVSSLLVSLFRVPRFVFGQSQRRDARLLVSISGPRLSCLGLLVPLAGGDSQFRG